jgi:energy-coupling factor transporter ATP-binding protein EcfA2
LLFLDEPLATLDTCCQKELMTYLQELIQTQDLCVVLCDHHLEGFDDFIKGRILFHRGHDEAVATLQVEINHKGENRP